MDAPEPITDPAVAVGFLHRLGAPVNLDLCCFTKCEITKKSKIVGN